MEKAVRGRNQPTRSKTLVVQSAGVPPSPRLVGTLTGTRRSVEQASFTFGRQILATVGGGRVTHYTKAHREYVCPKDGHAVLIPHTSTCYPLNILCGPCFDCQKGLYEMPRGTLLLPPELNRREPHRMAHHAPLQALTRGCLSPNTSLALPYSFSHSLARDRPQ